MTASKRPIKLSAAQHELLRRVSNGRTPRVASYYAPARILAELGLVTIEYTKPPYAWEVRVTLEGKAFLAAQQQSEASNADPA